ncbi:MAG: sigma-70 family RNA polymerase sigma factor [Planctomycetes bacterium]|nr:sigma-70 family RNA polymerase sigma factor [Planctomycetota bacterium]MCA8934930.1 sigma-70 family RNA polymerase sigma factor [Planctomycetota bacterium]
MKATKTKPVTKELKERFEDEALPLMQDMFAQAYHLTRNRADAEDLVQEAYIRGMRKFEQFEPGTNLKAWLGRILFNQFINEYRRKKRRIKSVFVEGVENMAGVEDQPENDERFAFMAPGNLAKDDAFMQSLDQDLKDGLEELDGRYRDVLLLNTVGELSYKDIASKLKLPIGTVMSRLHRAKAFLRERFGGKAPAMN